MCALIGYCKCITSLVNGDLVGKMFDIFKLLSTRCSIFWCFDITEHRP